MRWPNWFIYPWCGHNRCYRLLKRGLYQCNSCKYKSSVTASTVMNIKTESWQVYYVATEQRHAHQVDIVSARKVRKFLKCVHVPVSNAKDYTLGAYHGLQEHMYGRNPICVRPHGHSLLARITQSSY